MGGLTTAIAEEPRFEQTSSPEGELEPSIPSGQEVQSRGFLPNFPSPPPAPKIRPLSTAEKNLAKSVFQNTINYDMVKITDTLGAGARPWTTNTHPLYMINVGGDYPNLTANNDRKRLLIHELTHVWQGQHLVPFMLNSAAHQSLSAINNGGDTAPAYSYTVGKSWGQYNVEKQASIVAHWFTPGNICFENVPCGGGMKTTDSRYRYIRDNIRKNKAN
ncbi:MAG: hypothetical protein ABI618_12925 [Nitrospirota bacterium]